MSDQSAEQQASLRDEMNDVRRGQPRSAVSRLGGASGLLQKVRQTTPMDDSVGAEYRGDVVIRPWEIQQLADCLVRPDCGLTTLYLADNHLGDDAIAQLAVGLSKNTSVKKLVLWANDIGPVGANALKNNLQSSCIEHLGLWGNPLGDKGAVLIADLFRACKSLTSIDLGDCRIRNRGVMQIASAIVSAPNVTRVDLRYNQFGTSGAHALAQAFSQSTTLAYLDIRFNPVGIDGRAALEDARTEGIRSGAANGRRLLYDRDP